MKDLDEIRDEDVVELKVCKGCDKIYSPSVYAPLLLEFFKATVENLERGAFKRYYTVDRKSLCDRDYLKAVGEVVDWE